MRARGEKPNRTTNNNNQKQRKNKNMPLALPLAKPGDVVQKLQLSLNKGARFTVELRWDSTHDVDAHALLATNGGNGAKVNDFAQVLSTYNAKSTNPNGMLVTNQDRSFSTPCGALTHSGDARTGVTTDIDELITIFGDKVGSEVNEIPIFVTVHGGATFAGVKSASITIKDDEGKVLGEYQLTNEFAAFNAVQMGSLIRSDKGWEYAPVGSGFMGDFNAVLGYFS